MVDTFVYSIDELNGDKKSTNRTNELGPPNYLLSTE